VGDFCLFACFTSRRHSAHAQGAAYKLCDVCDETVSINCCSCLPASALRAFLQYRYLKEVSLCMLTWCLGINFLGSMTPRGCNHKNFYQNFLGLRDDACEISDRHLEEIFRGTIPANIVPLKINYRQLGWRLPFFRSILQTNF
jgi:hypothetical protein